MAFLIMFMFMPMQFPLSALAVSGGPKPPEFSTFQKVSPGDMVDPFTGNVQYSLPLFEIGGYPINLTYSGDIHPEQNAGWVGLGWSLQAGSIGRAMRGIPDDFKGDVIEKEVNTKPRVIRTFNFQQKDKDGKQIELVGLTGGFKIPGFPQIVHDNYRGLGIDYDINYEFQLKNKLDSLLADTVAKNPVVKTLNKLKGLMDEYGDEDEGDGNLDFNTHYSAFEGNTYEIVPKVGFIENWASEKIFGKDRKLNILLGSPAIRFSTSHGLESVGLSGGVSTRGRQQRGMVNNFSYNFFAPSSVPSFNPDIYASVWNTAFELGGDKFFADARKMNLHVTTSIEKFQENKIERHAYGTLYNLEGQKKENVILDQQTPSVLVDKYTQSVPMTVASYDVFNISAHGVGGSFKIKHNSIDIINPPTNKVSTLRNPKIHLELGTGTNAQIAGDVGLRSVYKKTGKWELQNEAAGKLEYKGTTVNDDYRPFELRNSFEFIESNTDIINDLGGLEPTKFALARGAKYKKRPSAWRVTNEMFDEENVLVNTVGSPVINGDRTAQQQSITYLTAKQAEKHGILTDISCYKFVSSTPDCEEIFQPQLSQTLSGDYVFDKYTISRDEQYRGPHHISEINVLQPSGAMYNFGLPVYQVNHREVSFSIDPDNFQSGPTRTIDNYYDGLVSYIPRYSMDHQGTINEQTNGENAITNKLGIDNFFHEQNTPAYANAYLLTNILSQDYSDLTGDGPTSDDLGTFVKFNYSMPDYDPIAHVGDEYQHLFKWRSPHNNANWSRGYKSDKLDDRANYSYGMREQWYMHSIETKDRIVLFELQNRHDGYGKEGAFDNGPPPTNRQKHLTRVIIYNRDDFERNGTSAKPIREIKLHYSYDLCVGVSSYIDPAITGTCNDHPLADFDDAYKQTASPAKYKHNGGKLTLHKVEFIEGELGMVTKNPYVFEYKTLNPGYQYNSTDRWGTYHQRDVYEDPNLNGEFQTTLMDFPYTNQDKANLDQWAGAWMLSDITLPSGSGISLEYESDDYAYVQDKQAMVMTKIRGVRDKLASDDSNLLYDDEGTGGQTKANPTGIELLAPNKYVMFDMEPGTTIEQYVPHEQLIYFSFNVNLAKRWEADAYEQVSGFFEVQSYGKISGQDIGYILIKPYKLKKAVDQRVHPVTKMAWQFAFSNLPHLMNPKGYTLRSSGTEKTADLANQIIGVVPEYVKSLTGPSIYYMAQGHAQKFDPTKSYLRLLKPDNIKLGGGHRVKRVTISDNWDQMTGNDEPKAEYTTLYEYKNTDNSSSGVAIYEPFNGGDENPFKLPHKYEALEDIFIKKRPGRNSGPVSISYDLGPVGEEFFPAPGVGYGKVTVRNERPSEYIVRHASGRTEYEFYTAKDFPTKSKMTTIDRRVRRFSSAVGAVHQDTFDRVTSYKKKIAKGETDIMKATDKENKTKFGLDVRVNIGFGAVSQGFLIEQNDMHGKPKAVRTYKNGVTEPISYTEYKYKQSGDELDNTVIVLREDGKFEEVEMGVQMDPTIFAVQTIQINQDAAIAPNFDINNNAVPTLISIFGDYAGYSNTSRIITVTKQVFRNGILERVDVNDKGAKNYTLNKAWDPVTGKVLITESKDEFDDAVYSMSKPAYWMNKSLAGSYNNVNLIVRLTQNGNVLTDNSGKLIVGDVLVENSFNNSNRYWVLDVDPAINRVYLIDATGSSVIPPDVDLRVFRSGHKNLLNYGAESVVMKTNPLNPNTNRWDDSYTKVISASAVDYNDVRQMMFKFDYCYDVMCNGHIDGTGSQGEMTDYGHGYWETPTSYGNFGYTYETFSEHSNPSYFFAAPIPVDFCGSADVVVCNGSQFSNSDVINPFVYGLKGIWLPSSQLVYYDIRNDHAQRIQVQTTQSDPNTTDIRESGYLSDFQPYWKYNGTAHDWEKNSVTDNPWTWKSKVTKTDFYGNDLETQSALNDIKSCMLYDYSRKLPVASVVNSAYNESLFDGFEDYSIDSHVELVCTQTGDDPVISKTITTSWDEEFCNQYRHWRVGDALVGGKNRISSQHAHTGNHSLMIRPGITHISMLNSDQPTSTNNRTYPISEYALEDTDFVPNFYLKPAQEKEYILSLWVKEAVTNQFGLTLQKLDASLTETNLPYSQETSEVSVNGWKKITIRFTLLQNEQLANMAFDNRQDDHLGRGVAPCYVDDIMLYPAEAVMNAYVYDRDRKRLMATLNPNNYATFYEYDKEGKMVRQKVETDRGIMTTGESYQSFKN